MSDRLVVNEEKGELRIDGRRHVAIEITTLLDFMDSLIGTRIAEVIINNIESRLGGEDCGHLRKQKPQASVREIATDLAHVDLISGIGITRFVFSGDKPEEITVETLNPCVTKTTGAAKSFGSSYYRGAFSVLLGKEFEVRDLVYDAKANVRRFRLVPRGTG
jgi:hypothetical protein